MLNIAQEPAGEKTLIMHIEGELTIETVAELRESLLEAFAAPWKNIQIEADNLSGIDFFGLQLLCAAHRTAASKDKVFSWQSERPGFLDEAMLVAGFTRHCGCSLCPPGQKCMWI
jgi:anti-anti-sigma regulatory factor